MKLERVIHRVSFGRLMKPSPVVAVLRLEGVIAARGMLRRPGLSLPALGPSIDRAFRLKGLAAVALAINSPGGSPAQSALIHGRIRQLAGEHAVPVLAFAEDVAASGGYWLALAGDEIWATESSILGSIGVISAGFGFPELLRRLGVERRVHTAGESKTLLDPFRPEKEDEVARLKNLQIDIHEGFKELVRARRGSRLKEDDDIFTGAIFTGRQALARGLIDGIGEMREVLRARFGEAVRLRPIEPRGGGWLRRRVPSIARSGGPVELALDFVDALEERAIWARFGL